MNPILPAIKQNRSLLSGVILVAGLSLSTIGAIFAFRAFDADESQRFSEAVDEIHGGLQARLDSFATSIRQLAATYAIDPTLSEPSFLNYATTAGIRANDAGVYSYGIFKRLPGSRIDQDRYLLTLRELGPDRPSPLAPLGTDVSKDTDRVQLFLNAIDSARAELSTRVPGLFPSHNSGQMMAVAAYADNRVPVTIPERRQKAIGIAYVRLSESGLFDQVLQSAVGSYKSHLNVQVYDGPVNSVIAGESQPIYEHRTSSAQTKLNLARSDLFEIKVGGRLFSIRVFSPDSQLWSTASFVAILLLSVGVALSLLTFRVIRRREERSHRLVKSERQLKLITESLPVMIAYIDDQYVYRFNNRVYEEILNRPRSEITHHKVADVVGPTYAERFGSQFERAMKGERVEQDWSSKRPNGTIRRFHQVLLPDFNHRGEVKGIVALHTDITERAKAQERASFLGEVSSILATSLDPVIVAEKLTQKLLSLCDWCSIELLDEEGKVDRHRYAASTPERFKVIRDFYQDFPPMSDDRRMNARARETKQTQYMAHVTADALRATTPDPERLRRLLQLGFESIVIVPLMSGDRALGTLALYSGDKERAFTLDDVHFFEEIALRASLAFENARLYAQSQTLNRAKDNFLAMLSHELRTPMNVILGWLEILTTETVDQETYKQALDTLNRNANVQIQLINDLLDVSRIINGKLSLHATKSDLGTLAREALDSVQPAVRAKNIQCTLTVEGDLQATIDAERIQQVLWNLLSNAVKFTPSGGRIEIRVIGSQRDVRISVSDSGQGIDADFLPFVFDRFRQEEGGFTRTQGGLGLGLSIVRYIVEGHGGTIGVTSSGRDRGTTFTVVLPKSAQISDEIHLTPLAP